MSHSQNTTTRSKTIIWTALIITLVVISFGYYFYPVLIFKVAQIQKFLHKELYGSFRLLNTEQDSFKAGISLIIAGFVYGLVHALGPGHGKFILGSYLALNKVQFAKSVKLSFIASMLQGVVAIVAVGVLVGIFAISRQSLNLTLSFVEKFSFVMIIALGAFWCYQALKKTKCHTHNHSCGCKCNHLVVEPKENKTNKLVIILGVALRPCSGAILLLLLSYSLNLFVFGILSALAMALGTSITLMLLASFVWFSRNSAIKFYKFYDTKNKFDWLRIFKFIFGLVLILFGILLLQTSFLVQPNNPFIR